MIFEGTIIITDPCYFIKDEDWESTNFGKSLHNIGFFTNYFVRNTIYGNWGCTIYSCKNHPMYILDDLYEADMEYFSNEVTLESEEKYYSKLAKIEASSKSIGTFTADSGQVGVFYLEEVLKYNPDFNVEENSIATIIKDFRGSVEYYIDGGNQAHIIGMGNINFYSLQTSY